MNTKVPVEKDDEYYKQESDKYYYEIYPEQKGISCMAKDLPVPISLYDIGLRAVYSKYAPTETDISAQLGPVHMNTAIMAAAMNTITGPKFNQRFSDFGGAGIIWRNPDLDTQLDIIKQSLDYKPCFLSDPVTLNAGDKMEKLYRIHNEKKVKKVPILDDNGKLLGVAFTKRIVFNPENFKDRITDYMMKLDELTIREDTISFCHVDQYFRNKKIDDFTLPIVDSSGVFKGMYFLKDFLGVNPISFNGKPLVGTAIGTGEEDFEFAKLAVDAGVGILVIDSSHGSGDNVINQAKRLVKAFKGDVAIVAGNITDIEGYLRLADAGVDAVKYGIGGGEICTTSIQTRVGFPMYTGLKEIKYVKQKRMAQNQPAPLLIADGGVRGYDIAISAFTCADIVMAGGWFVVAKESQSYQNGWVKEEEDGVEKVLYYGMASKEAMKLTLQVERYGKQKTAPEGESGYKEVRGELRKWFTKDLEYIHGALAHMGAKNIPMFHDQCDHPQAVYLLSSGGKLQNHPRIKDM